MSLMTMITGLADDTDSVLFVNPKFTKLRPQPSLDIFKAKDDSKGPSASKINEYISCVIAMLHGVEVFCYLPILYIFKDDFKLGPGLFNFKKFIVATLIFALGLIRFPMNVKLLFALISDGVPIFNSRRKVYLAIGSFLCFASTFTLGFFGHLSVYITCTLLGCLSCGLAICSIIGEALVIETGHKRSNDEVTKTISIFCAFRKVTFAAMSYLSSVLITKIQKHASFHRLLIYHLQKIFLMASALPFVILLITPLVVESDVVVVSVSQQWKKLCKFASRKEIKEPTLFLFLSMLVPSAGAALFYFMTEALHFKPELFGRIAAIQAVASLVGIYVYATLLTQTSIRKLYIWSSILVALFCTVAIALVKRYNVAWGIPDTAFVITDSSMLQFVGEINSLPIFIMATRLCPRGLESSMYSLLWTAQFLGLDISSYISAALTYGFGIKANHFDGLVWLILTCACLHLLPISLVSMLPETIPTVALPPEEEPCLSDEDPQLLDN